MCSSKTEQTHSKMKSTNITTEANLVDSKKHVENFSCEGQSKDSLHDTTQFVGTKEDALHPAVLHSKTRSAKFARTPLLYALVASIADCLQVQESKAKHED